MDITGSILQNFEISETLLPVSASDEERIRTLRTLLIQRIEELVQRDLEKLKWILYRIDVNEKKLHETLQHSDADAATVMADLIIERQIQKAESRKKFGGNENDWDFDI